MKLCADPETMPDGDGLLSAMKPELNKIFKPAFLGRMLIVPYFPVRDEALKQIIRLKLGKIQRRLAETHRISMVYDDVLLNEVAARCTEVESGARNVDNILSNTMLPDLSRQILGRLAEGVAAEKVSVSVKDGGLTYDWGAAA
jgi:type VI secretion system protein VasG